MNLEAIFRACRDLVGLLSQASVEEGRPHLVHSSKTNRPAGLRI